MNEYPVLAWKWRPREFPHGAREKGGRNDSVLGVYVGFRAPLASLKYIWSETVPAGEEWSTGFLGRTKMRVAMSGRSGDVNRWHDVRVNVADDFKRRLNRPNAGEATGIAVLTDADDTGRHAEGDYAEFEMCRS